MLHPQDILWNINQAYIQINLINAPYSNTMVEIEKAIINSVNIKHENVVELGKENYSDFDNVQGKTQTLLGKRDNSRRIYATEHNYR